MSKASLIAALKVDFADSPATGDIAAENIGESIYDETVGSSLSWTNVSYINDWVDYGGDYPSVAYTKDNLGFVHLRGVMKNGSDSACFTLPENFRPTHRKLLPIASSTYTTQGTIVVISTAGAVTILGYGTSYVSFDGVIFEAA